MKQIYTLFKCSLLVVFLLSGICSPAQTTGTGDGTYDFGTLGTSDSGGVGFKTQGDKFVVSNALLVWGTALYLDNSNGATVIFKAEGGSVMKQATVEDLTIGSAGWTWTLSRFDITLTNYSGTTIATHSLSGTQVVADPDDIAISSFSFSTAWPAGGYDGVSEISITYELNGPTPTFEFRSITLSNISTEVSSNAAPTATAPSAPSVTEDATNVVLADDIQVADTDADDQTVAFTITGGTLTIGTDGSITFPLGSNGSNSFSATGKLDDINTALDAATFTPTPNLSGTGVAEISFTTSDGTDISSAAVIFDIAAVNDEPTLSATGDDPPFTEDGSAAVLFSSASASTVESGQTLSALTIIVTNVNDGSYERLNLDGTAIVLTHVTFGTTAENSLSYSVSVSSTTATISLSGGTLSTFAFETLINAISYQNNSNTPNPSDRVVTITSLTDSGGTDNSGDDTASLAVASTVTVLAANDAPILSSFATVVETTTQNTEIEITLADLRAQGDENDVDGTVDAFIVKAVSTGTLKIGANSGAATAFDAASNKTIDATNNAYWTPANNASGILNAFTTVVIDNNSAESVGAVQAVVTVNDVTAPLLVSNSPLDNATNVNLGENIILNFDDNMVAGTGNITIRRASDNTAFEQIAIGDPKITISSNQVTINPANPLVRGIAYYIEIDATALDDDSNNSFAGISGNSILNFTAVDVVINEVVTDPQQDWSTNGFNGIVDAGAISSGTDEWVELLINSDGIDFTGWTLELLDGSDVTGDLSSTGAFDVSNYLGSGSFANTTSGDYLVLGNVDGTGAMNNSGLTINLKDPGGAIVDAVVIGGGVGQAPLGDANGFYNEAVQRYTNGLDTDVHSNDFTLGMASIGSVNIGPSVTLSVSSPITEASGVSTITATLSAASSLDVTVTLAVDGLSTAAPADYTLSSSSIVIVAGSTTGTATITATQDLKDENDETVIVNMIGVTNGTEAGTQQKAITITDDDVNPVVTASQTFSVDEDAVNTASVGTVLATDGNAGTTFSSWTITSGNDDAIFDINSTSGKITVEDNSNLDFETTTSYTLSVTVSDGVNISSVETVSINVNDINDEVPVVTASQSFSVDEDALNDASVGTVLVNDADAGTSYSVWTITSGNDDAIFAINSTSGKITVADNSNLDFETTTSYTLSVTVSDGVNISSVEAVSINVNDINDEVPVVTASQSFSVDEDVLNDASVGIVLVNDADAGTSYSVWTITSGNDDAIFAINSTSGKITVADNSNLDFETTTSYTLSVTVSDGVNISSVETVSINVNDINDEVPVVTASQSFSVDEDALNDASVGTVLVNDADAGTSYSVWTITSGNDDAIFAINSTSGKITVADNSNLDFETTTSYTLSVTVSDGVNISSVETVSIEIEDANEAPSAIQLSNTTIAENSAIGTEVGTLSASDVDASQTFTYTMAENANFEIVVDKLVSKAAFDFETQDSYTVEITVADQDGLTHKQSFTISVQDINEKPTDISLSNNIWVENAPAGTLIGTLSAEDPDDNQTFTYSTIQPEFEIIGDEIFVKVPLDRESYHYGVSGQGINIVVTDQNGASFNKVFVMRFKDVNEAPTAIQLSGNIVVENAAVGTIIGDLSATDEDYHERFVFTIYESNLFEIVDNKLQVKGDVNYEEQSSHDLEITVTDKGGLNFKQSFIVQITDVNEEPTAIQLSANSIAENSAIGTEVGTLSASDVDASQTFTYSISENENFEIVGDKLVSKAGFDFETLDNYSVVITVADQDGLSFKESFSIQITDVNEAPTAISLSNVTIVENAAVGTEVGLLTASDVDASQTFTYSISENENFEIVGDKLVSKVGFDFETKNSYSVEITVTDQGGLTHKQSFSIEITDANDAPNEIQLSNATIAENSPVGTEVGTLSASDVDASQTFTYTIAENENFEIVGDKLVSKVGFDFETKDSYSVEITVTDQGGLTHKQSFSIEITDANDAPVFTSEAITAGAEDVEYVYPVECVDVDGDAISLLAIEKPDWLNMLDNGDGTCILSGMPATGGLYHVILEASDSEFTTQQEFDINVEVVTGIEADFTDMKVDIYPNPVANELHIDLSNFKGEDLNIALYSLTGSLIFKERHESLGEEVRIGKSFQNLGSGMYLLVLEMDGVRKTYKIVKE